MEISKEDLIKDCRFYIDKRNLDRLTHQKILNYKIQRKKVGMILRAVPNTSRIVTLAETRVYAYLTGTYEGEKEYDEYVKMCNAPFRNKESYDKLIDEMSKNPYDIKKCAVIVNQDDIICDGQHRCCYMLYKYGPNYKIDVVKFRYNEVRGFTSLIKYKCRVILAKLRATIICNRSTLIRGIRKL